MDEQEKPFDTISIIILLSLAVANDGAEIFFDVLASTMVGLPGEAIMEPIDFIVDAVVTYWFFSKCGFGASSFMQIIDDLLESVGVPGRTICVGAGIFMANHPKLAAVAEVAGAAALTSGVGAIAAEAGETAEVGAVAAEGATATEGAAISSEAAAEAESAAGGGIRGAAEEAEGGGRIPEEAPSGKEGGGEGEGGEEEEKRKKLEEEMEPKEERPPEEVLRKELLEQTPTSENEEEEEDEGEGEEAEGSEQDAQNSNFASGDEFQKRAEEIKRRQTGLPNAPKIIPLDEEGEDDLAEAA